MSLKYFNTFIKLLKEKEKINIKLNLFDALYKYYNYYKSPHLKCLHYQVICKS